MVYTLLLLNCFHPPPITKSLNLVTASGLGLGVNLATLDADTFFTIYAPLRGNVLFTEHAHQQCTRLMLHLLHLLLGGIVMAMLVVVLLIRQRLQFPLRCLHNNLLWSLQNLVRVWPLVLVLVLVLRLVLVLLLWL
jgi:hypothetical protein